MKNAKNRLQGIVKSSATGSKGLIWVIAIGIFLVATVWLAIGIMGFLK